MNKAPERETITYFDEETGAVGIGCKLDQSQCDHEFGDQGMEDDGICVKCGTSIWAFAFMECP